MKKSGPNNIKPLQGQGKISNFFTIIPSTTQRVQTSPKRKLDSSPSFEMVSPPKKKLDIKKSPSQNGASTSSAYFSPERTTASIFVKSSEKLLSNSVLQEFKTPEKVKLGRSRSGSQSTTPKALFRDESNVTPTKKALTPRKSPSPRKKLMERSPTNLNEFNVQAFENFVKISPRNGTRKISIDEDLQIVGGEKVQRSILQYISPVSASRSSFEARRQNELTPKKKTPVKDGARLSCSAKLDFESDKENVGEYDFTLEFEDSFELPDEVSYNLDFSTIQHCKIVEINALPSKTVLIVKSSSSAEQGIVNVQGFWMDVNLRIGDIVHIKGVKRGMDWLIDNNDGFLIYEPDLLVSCTSLVSTTFCQRRTVLRERFKGVFTSNKFMLVGTIVHELLQKALRAKYRHLDQLERAMKKMVQGTSVVKSLYECDLSFADIEPDIQAYLPKIHNFITNYVQFGDNGIRRTVKPADNWQGMIDTIEDIEDNIWCTDLGLKGKIDVSIQSNKHVMMPLELKTGKASVSIEHKAQVMLYVMMMNQLGIQANSGLLLYLKEGVLKEIPATESERRHLILMRNELAYYLNAKPIIGKDLIPLELPEPINHPGCKSCQYNVICASYLKYNKQESNNYLKEIQETQMSHLTEAHLNYFITWTVLLDYEANAQQYRKDVRQIYTVPAEEREGSGSCIINLVVDQIEEEGNGLYVHTFKKTDFNFINCGFGIGTYVTVSIDNRPAVAAGYIRSIDVDRIVLTLETHLLRKFPQSPKFHIDSYDSNNTSTFNRTNLTLLLENTPKAEQLRKIIVDKAPPTFAKKIPKLVLTKGKEILKRLNKIQQRAVMRALTADDYLLIKGMPGTGKTETVVALIELLVALGKSVIITSHTHSAIDNVCLRLMKVEVDFLRLGNENRLHDKLLPYSEHKLIEGCTTPEELAKAYNNINVLAVTCLGSGHTLLSKREFDYCIVDESTQVQQSSVLRTLYAAEIFILIGDQDQLAPVVKSKDALANGMGESLFERLHSPQSVIALNLNYRMNKYITKIANVLTYNGELMVANEEVANANLKVPNKAELLNNPRWLVHALSTNLEDSVTFLDTGRVWHLRHTVKWLLDQDLIENNKNKRLINIYEAAIVYRLVNALLKAGLTSDQIGVIATYAAQVSQIAAILGSTEVDVSTVDKFQGKDKNVIIYSCTKFTDRGNDVDNNKYELLADQRRLTVAITRPKNKLILVGDVSVLKNYNSFDKMLSSIENVIHLTEDKHNFSWDSVLDI